MLMHCASAVCCAVSGGVLLHAGYMLCVCVPGLLLASRMYSLYKPGGGLPLPSPTKTLAAAVGTLLPRNLPAAAYSLLTLAFAGMAVLCLSAAPGGVMKMYAGFYGEWTRGKTGYGAGQVRCCQQHVPATSSKTEDPCAGTGRSTERADLAHQVV